MNKNVRNKAMQIVKEIRNNGHSVDIDLQRRSVKAMMREANKKRAKYSIVIGENELQSGEVNIKTMDNGKVKTVKIGKINDFLSV